MKIQYSAMLVALLTTTSLTSASAVEAGRRYRKPPVREAPVMDCREIQREIQVHIAGLEDSPRIRWRVVRSVAHHLRRQVSRRRLHPSCAMCVLRQFARRVPVAEQGPCGAHDRCVTGSRLSPSSHACVEAVCAERPRCCKRRWGNACVEAVTSVCDEACDGCEHGECVEGRPLASECNECTATICDGDPYCCDTSWDVRCVETALNACDEPCQATTTTTSTTSTSSTTVTTITTVTTMTPATTTTTLAACSRDCDDGDVCTDDGCDAGGTCRYTSNAASCDDGNPCTTGDACVARHCVGGPPLDCNDGDRCTLDYCSFGGGCQHMPVGCSDGSACTLDSCDSITGCRTDPIDCDDGDPCTVDGCDIVRGCVHTPVVGTPSCP